MLLLGLALIAAESVVEHPNATSQARLLSSTIVLEYECGDLETCVHSRTGQPLINDGQCDDGGPSASYWECPRFSDATDCGTLCDQHAGSLPPPPPSCVLKQWASALLSAESSSYYGEEYRATEATGAPTNPLTCSTTSSRTVLGSWSPQHRHAEDNWLLTRFDQVVHPTALRIHEHANPPEESGFVTSVDLYAGPPCRCRVPPCRCLTNFSTGWLFGVWELAVDPTPCGGSLTLHADTATVDLSALEVSACRIHTRTNRTLQGGYEYIDAVQLEGTLCNATTGERSIAYSPPAPPGSAPAPSPPSPHRVPRPPPSPPGGSLEPARASPPASSPPAALPPLPSRWGNAPRAPPPPPPPRVSRLQSPMRMPELAALILLGSSFVMCACCWLAVASHCRRVAALQPGGHALRGSRASVDVAPPSAIPPYTGGIPRDPYTGGGRGGGGGGGGGGGDAPVLLTNSSVQRASDAATSGCEHVTVELHKPQSSSGLGIRLEQLPVRTRDGHARAVVVSALVRFS